MANNKYQCRICAKPNFRESQNIFEQPEGKLLRHIEQLTGVMLKNAKYLPKHICSGCFMDLRQARAFRRRCLKAQNYFATIEYRKELEANNQQQQENRKTMQAEQENVVGTTTTSIDNDNNNEMMETTESEFLHDAEAAVAYESNDNLSHNENKVILDAEVEEEEVPSTADYKIVEFEFTKCGRRTSKIATSSHNKSNNHSKFAKAKIVKHNKGIKKRSITEYVCEQCGNSYDNVNHFRTHLNRHAGIKPFECENCPSKFYTKSELKIHTLSHTGERSFECRYCSRRFLRSYKRLEHERLHTNERPYKCTYCPKDFRTSCSLKDHLLTHTEERNFECTVCNKYFQRPTHLVAHNRSKFHKENVDKQNNLNNVDSN